MHTLRYIFLVALLIRLCLAFSQEPVYRHYTEADGLPSSEVYHVFQDSKDYIWFATNNGVSRFNGTSFTNFGIKDGLPELTVFEIFEDYKGRIWFISLTGELSHYANETITQYRYNNILKEHTANTNGPNKYGFYVDNKENVYLSVDSKGIFCISNKGRLNRIIIEDDCTQAMICPINDSVSLLSRGNKRNNCSGAGDVHIRLDSLNSVIKHNVEIAKHMKGNVRSLLLNTENSYYISGNNVLLAPEKSETYSFTSHILSLGVDTDNNLWIGVMNGGVYCFEKSELINKPRYHFFRNESITSVLNDNEGGYWFSSYSNGVYYMPYINNRLLEHTLRGNKNMFGAIIKYNDTLIAAIKNTNLYIKSDLNTGAQQLASISSNGNIINTFAIYRGELLIATSNGMYDMRNNKLAIDYHTKTAFMTYIKKNKTINELTLKANDRAKMSHNIYEYDWLNGSIRSVQFKNNHLFIGSNMGLAVLHNESVLQSLKDPKTIVTTYDVYPVNQDKVFLGAQDGLWLWDNKGYTYLGNDNQYLQHRINDITGNRDNSKIFLATKGAGLIVMEKDSLWIIDSKNGLSGDIIQSIAYSDSTLWVATNKGLNYINFNSMLSGKYTICTLTTLHGLSSNFINHVYIDGPMIYLGTDNGIFYFNKNKLRTNTNPPPVYISKVIINSRDTVLQEKYELNYRQNNISIGIEGLTYRSNGNIQYRYQLTDTVWQYTNNSLLQFHSLSEGRYNFVAEASNEDGVWSSEPASIRFIIHPPYWKTWWFRLTTILFLLLIIVFIIIWQFRAIIKRNKMKTDMIAIRQQALGSQMNPHFIFNSLNSIQNFILQNDRVASQEYLSTFADLMRKVLVNSQNTTITLNEELSAIKLYLELEKARFEGKFSYNISVDNNVNTQKVELPPLILQPFIENATWHGLMQLKSEGKLNILVTLVKGEVVCIVRDNGIGRQKAKELKKRKTNTYQSMGTIITGKRINLFNLLHGTNMRINYVDLTDNKGDVCGTKVEIHIPVELNKKK